MSMMPLAFGIPGGPELFVIAGIALLIFGNRLPGVMRSLGQGVTEFKKGINGIEDDIDTAATADKKPTATTTTTTSAAQPTTHE